jgi:hypothetical protein
MTTTKPKAKVAKKSGLGHDRMKAVLGPKKISTRTIGTGSFEESDLEIWAQVHAVPVVGWLNYAWCS